MGVGMDAERINGLGSSAPAPATDAGALRAGAAMQAACVLLLTMPATAAAQTLYKCEAAGGGGAPVYQSEPCAAGQEASRTWEASSFRISPERRQQLESRRARQAQARSRTPAVAGRGSARGQNSAVERKRRCEAAREWRRRQLAALGLDRTYEDLSRIDRHVREQCG